MIWEDDRSINHFERLRGKESVIWNHVITQVQFQPLPVIHCPTLERTTNRFGPLVPKLYNCYHYSSCFRRMSQRVRK